MEIMVTAESLKRVKEVYDRLEYADNLRRCGPLSRVKFVGTKHLSCPFSGEKYHFTIFCGIDTSVTSVLWMCNNNSTYDSSDFSDSVSHAVKCGWLKRGDVLVMNNAKINTGGENAELKNDLWEIAGVAVLYLPPRSPNLTPVTGVWEEANRMVDVCAKNPYNPDEVAYLAQRALASFSHDDIYNKVCVCYERAFGGRHR